MTEQAQFMKELVCGACGHTAHITWEGEGEARRVVNMSDGIRLHAASPPRFTCAHCGAVQAQI
jgi:ribosomal protein S27AE